ncbi:MAG: hypothetical protein ACI92C_002580, partial [Neolewinella sp.]
DGKDVSAVAGAKIAYLVASFFEGGLEVGVGGFV